MREREPRGSRDCLFSLARRKVKMMMLWLLKDYTRIVFIEQLDDWTFVFMLLCWIFDFGYLWCWRRLFPFLSVLTFCRAAVRNILCLQAAVNVSAYHPLLFHPAILLMFLISSTCFMQDTIFICCACAVYTYAWNTPYSVSFTILLVNMSSHARPFFLSYLQLFAWHSCH